MISPTEEDFELELRSLPGVVNVGFEYRDNGDVDLVTLVVNGDETALNVVAKQVVSLYYPDAGLRLERLRATSGARSVEGQRVVLVSATFNQNDGICEITLNYEGRIGVGRSTSGPLIGGAEATMTALRDLGFEVPFYLVAALNVSTVRGWPVIVTLRSHSNDADRYGISQSDGELISSARATLDALNRFLATVARFE
jgi:hypothetical protein